MKKRLTLLSFAVAAVLLVVIAYQISGGSAKDDTNNIRVNTSVSEAPVTDPVYKFGIPVVSFEVVESIVERGESIE